VRREKAICFEPPPLLVDDSLDNFRTADHHLSPSVIAMGVQVSNHGTIRVGIATRLPETGHRIRLLV
jgi:hypothetical protein